MSLRLFRAIGTGSLLKNTCRIPTTFVAENLKHFKPLRMLSSDPKILGSDNPPIEKKNYGPAPGFIPVFSLPLAGKLAFINSSKHKQLRILSIIAPISIAVAYLHIIPWETSNIICAAGVIIALKLHLMGILATNMIGFVYISSDMSTVQISYIDQEGKRQEEFFPASEIVPLSETPSNRMETLYSHVLTYSKQGSVPHYKLCLAFGKIIDKKGFNHIFGN